MAKGWIKLYRQSADNSLYHSEPFDKWHAWVDILLMVNHEQKQFISKGQVVNLSPGQTITSDRILAKRWNWSKEKVRRYLRLLIETNMCIVKRTPNGTTITVVNWAKYQNDVSSNKTANKTTCETTDETTDETLTRMIKNDKEGEKGCRPPQSDEPDPHATDDEGIRRYLEAEEAKGRWS